MDVDGSDIIGWKDTNTRHFTIQSVYDLQRRNYRHIDGEWKKIWDCKGPHRIQTFMWMAAHERLLTNYRRSKWGIGVSPTFPTCGNGEETIIHVDWIFNNLTHEKYKAHEEDWRSIFLVTCWNFWKWRNKSIFEDDFHRPIDPIHIIFELVRAIGRSDHPHLPQGSRATDTIYIGWKRPHRDWVKLNCDGAYKESLDIAGCRGLIRDSNGHWLKGYARKIGTCDALYAEMWGMYEGLKIS